MVQFLTIENFCWQAFMRETYKTVPKLGRSVRTAKHSDVQTHQQGQAMQFIFIFDNCNSAGQEFIFDDWFIFDILYFKYLVNRVYIWSPT